MLVSVKSLLCMGITVCSRAQILSAADAIAARRKHTLICSASALEVTLLARGRVFVVFV